VGQPRRNMDKITGVRSRTIFTAHSPTDQAIALEHVCDGLLLPVMMDAGPGSGLNDEYPTPKFGCDALVDRDGGTPFGARRLGRPSVE
jgi:hypothetical protein